VKWENGPTSQMIEDLTDKYDILRGINRGAVHNVYDLKEKVQVHAGEEFWSWINGDEKQTQTWVLTGILEALKKSNIRSINKELLGSFEKAVSKKLGIDSGKKISNEDWYSLLKKVNTS